MFEQFIDLKYLISFPGMILIVMLLTQFTKALFDRMAENRTKFVAYGWCMVLTVLAAATLGDWSQPVSTIVVWLVNSVIVWFAAMKAYESIADTTRG